MKDRYTDKSKQDSNSGGRYDLVGSEMIKLITDTFACAPNQVTRQSTAADVDGWDSLSHAVLLVTIERRFGVRLSYDEVYAIADVGGLIDCVTRAVMAKAGPGRNPL
jgi:acyl carrier protein